MVVTENPRYGRGEKQVKSRYKVLQCSAILALILVLGNMALAAFPASQGFVNDFANVLDQTSRTEIQAIADRLQAEQGIELAVITISTTSPMDPKEYTTGVFNEWGVGGPEDSGLLMLLAVSEGAIEVEPGYGLEGVLPDGLIGAVIDQEGLPHFKNRAYGAGLLAMARAYAQILAGEKFEIAEESNDPNWLVSFIIFLIIVLFMRRGRRFPPSGSGGFGGGGGRSGRTVFVPRMPRGGGFGGSRPGGGFGGGRSGGGGAGRRF